jgi:dihydrolipoamide dehydrogenase
MGHEYDVVVIGGGPGGYIAAIRAAQYGASVAVVEKGPLGGTCLNRGCIPTKAMVTAVGLYSKLQESETMGVSATGVKADLARMVEYHQSVTAKLRSGVEGLMKSNGIAVFEGEGYLAGPGRVRVTSNEGTQEISATNVILATGSEPAVLDIMQPDGTVIFDSTSVLQLTVIPKSMVVVGAGAIGLEFACIFARLGVEVAVVEMLPRVLPLEDEETSKRLAGMLRKQGISLHLDSTVRKVDRTGSGVSVEVAAGEKRTVIEAEKMLVATGRKLNTSDIVAPELGLAMDGKAVKVDDRMATSIPGVYAVGDITGGWLLAHAASAEGLVAAANATGRDERMDYKVVPRATWTTPAVASVGMNETAAREAGRDVRIGKFMFSANGRALAMGETDGFVKIVADAATGEVLGVHIVGPEASELIAEAALAIRLECTAEEIAGTIHAHPTLPEAIAESAEDVLGLSIHQAPKRRG